MPKEGSLERIGEEELETCIIVRQHVSVVATAQEESHISAALNQFWQIYHELTDPEAKQAILAMMKAFLGTPSFSSGESFYLIYPDVCHAYARPIASANYPGDVQARRLFATDISGK